jgi:hypothetical protein
MVSWIDHVVRLEPALLRRRARTKRATMRVKGWLGKTSAHRGAGFHDGVHVRAGRPLGGRGEVVHQRA